MDHAKTRIRINKNVGGDALDRPLQPIEKTKEPIQKDGGAASQICLHFCPCVGGAKIKVRLGRALGGGARPRRI